MASLIVLSVFPAALIIAAANDLYEFKIPNWIAITLFCAYFAAGAAFGAGASEMLEGLLLAGAALTIGFGLFAMRILGGGLARDRAVDRALRSPAFPRQYGLFGRRSRRRASAFPQDAGAADLRPGAVGHAPPSEAQRHPLRCRDRRWRSPQFSAHAFISIGVRRLRRSVN